MSWVLVKVGLLAMREGARRVSSVVCILGLVLISKMNILEYEDLLRTWKEFSIPCHVVVNSISNFGMSFVYHFDWDEAPDNNGPIALDEGYDIFEWGVALDVLDFWSVLSRDVSHVYECIARDRAWRTFLLKVKDYEGVLFIFEAYPFREVYVRTRCYDV